MILARLTFGCILCLLCSALCAKEANENFSTEIVAKYAANWEATRSAYTNCGNTEKSHFVLGDCPKGSSIDLFYIATAIAHISTHAMLPEKYGKYLENTRLNLTATMSKDVKTVGFNMVF